MENLENTPRQNNQPHSSPLHIVSSHEEEQLQIQQQHQELEERELKIRKREDALSSHEMDLLKLKHQLSMERFKLYAKTLISLGALIMGFQLHMNEDNLGAFLIGSGLGGFGVTMATGTSPGTNNDNDK